MRITQQKLTDKNTDVRKFVKWLMKKRLLPRRFLCQSCGSRMRLYMSNKSADGVRMRCLVFGCRAQASVRGGAWFSDHPKLSLIQLMRVAVAFFANASITSTALQWDISIPTVSRVFANLRKRVSVEVDAKVAIDPGLTGAPVEIDCATLKHYRDDANQVAVPVVHVQGMLEPTTGVFRYQLVMDQKAVTLRPPISALVPLGSIVMTDEHKSYQTLDAEGYWHYRVNHNQGDYAHNDIDPQGFPLRVTTNHIESLWSQVKRKLRNPKFFTLGRLHEALKCAIYDKEAGDAWRVLRV